MQKYEQTKKREDKLILQTKAGDDDALKKLYYLYQPLINSVKQKYHVRDYDSQDWDQEALIICHQSAINYDCQRGRFSSYYKTRLTNHAKSLVRYNTAYRRRALLQSVSLETAQENGLGPLHRDQVSESQVPLTESLTEVVANLSNLEMNALLVTLGMASPEDVIELLAVDHKALGRARSRLLQKMRATLLK
ncbi:sigma-70 family RNA polymerase sigma factor [Lactobacillus xylocopicola]|uniref:DNA-directed RNA polymerase subunit sigma n=1 Tax=Lactobacillus xylocopicola TaxID=2976676 RepID=A0ABN6SNR6_9LACO|nr:sigma-70 family RNA polymerase sigma factor [Lactobacillus xylocopicola]BDR60837.1 DNA-directed RNA polymerase subunit sigma [Lactobacillus xylocopicola]